MVRKIGILVVCLIVSFILVVLALFSVSHFRNNENVPSITGDSILNSIWDESDNNRDILNQEESVSFIKEGVVLDREEFLEVEEDFFNKIKKSSNKESFAEDKSREEKEKKIILEEYKSKEIVKEELFFDKKFHDNGRYVVSSLNEYSAEWYPDDSPKKDLKKLVVELQVTDKVTGNNFSIKGTADIPKYYSGHFDFNTSLEDLVSFEGINPEFVWEYSEDFSIVYVKKKEERIKEGDILKSETFVKEKEFKNYKLLNEKLKENIPKGLFLDPDVSACGTLSTAGATYNLINNVSSSTTCFTISNQNITLDCHNYWITYSTGSGTPYYGVFSNQFNTTIKNCNIYSANRTVTYLYSAGIQLNAAHNSTLINNDIDVVNSQGIMLSNTNYSTLTFNKAIALYSQGIRLDYSSYNYLVNNTGETYNNEATGFTWGARYNVAINQTSIGQTERGTYFSFDSNYNLLITPNSTGQYAFQFSNSSHNTIVDCVNVQGTSYDVSYLSTSLIGVNNTFLNCSYDTEEIHSSNSINRKWYYQAYVNDTSGSPVSTANVTGRDSSSVVRFTELTNSSGWISRQNVTEYVNTGGTRTYYNNYNITASKSGYVQDTNIFNFTTTQNKINDFFTLDGGEAISPTITFESPTPSNTSSTTSPVTIVANISDASNTSSWIDFDRTLVGYWAMDYYNSTGVYDNSSWGNHVLFTGGMGVSNIITGIRGEGADLDGTNYVLTRSTLPLGTSATFEAWGYADTISGKMLWNHPTPAYSSYYDLFFTGSTICLNTGDSGSNPFKYPNGTNIGYPSLSVWHHYVVVVDAASNQAFLYLDGSYMGNASYRTPTNTNARTLSIGGASGYRWNGVIDEFRIYNRSLSASEVAAAYNSRVNKFNTSAMSLADGQHNYTVYAIDQSGNIANSGERNFIVGEADTTSPTITFEEPPTPTNGSTTSSPVTVVANISDASNTSSWIDFDRTLVGYWAMDYYNSTGVYDNSSWNNFATFYAGTTSSDLVDGARGNAFDFDGGAYNEGLRAYGLGAKTNEVFNSSGQLTFSFWVYPDVLANGTMGTDTVRVHISSGGQITVTMVNQTTNYNQFASSGVVSLGQWQHVALTYNRSNGNASSYHNGILVGSKIVLNANLTKTSDYFTIGTNWGDPFNGAMDEVMAFNRTLSQSEIKALYNSRVNKFNTSAMSLANGKHNYTVYAVDESGNIANSGLRNFIVSSGSVDCNTVGNSGVLDTIGGTYTLTSNVTSTGTCFTVTAANVTLNCNGYWITYSTDDGSGEFGVYSTQYNTTIKNCNVIDGYSSSNYNWRVGIILSGSNYSTLFNNSVTAYNSSAFDIRTFNALNLTRNIGRSWKDGMYIRLGFNSTFVNNTGISSDSYSDGEGITIEYLNNSVLDRNNGTSPYRGIVLATYSMNNNLTNNWGEGGTHTNNAGLLISGHSKNNLFINNTGKSPGSGIFFWNNSGSNVLVNNTGISTAGSAGLVFYTCSDNVAINQNATGLSSGGDAITIVDSNNSVIKDCVYLNSVDYDIQLGGASVNNTVLNCSYSLNKEYVGTNQQLIRKWYYQAYVNDTSGNPISSANVIGTQNSSLNQIVFESISLGSDDAEEVVSTGALDTTSTDLEITYDTANQYIGLRFQSLSIPRSATIESAVLEFVCDEASSGAGSVTILADDTDNAPTFSGTGNISSRTWTTNLSTWTFGEAWVAGVSYNSSDLKNVIQEVVDRDGWNTNNDLAIIINSSLTAKTDSRTAESYEGTDVAKLYITYSTPDSGFDVLTNSSGWISRQNVTEYVNNAGTRTYYNNYTINASKSGYTSDTNIFNFTSTQNKLNDFFTLEASGSTSPVITFEEPPTPTNNSYTSNPVAIVANISSTLNTSSWMDFERSLLGYWAMDYYNSTGIYDNSTWNNFGSFAGGSSSSDLTTGKRGDAFDFDGSSTSISVPTSNFDYVGNLTISLWVYPRDIITDYTRLIHKGDTTGATKGFGIVQSYDSRLVGFYQNSYYPTGEYMAATGILSNNQWYHVVMTYDDVGRVNMYVNGLNVSSPHSESWAAGTGNYFSIGKRAGLDNAYFNGSMDEILIFNRTLSETEIKALYSSQINKFNTSDMTLSQGQYDYTVYAIDENGTSANSGERNFIISNGPEDLGINFESPTPSNTSSTGPNVRVVANISGPAPLSSWIDFDRTLVGYWAMDYYNSTGVYDNSSYKNNATFQGGLSTSNIATGERGDALRFDGSNDYLKVKDSNSLDIGTSDFSISFWANLGRQDGGYSAIIGKKTGSWADTGSGYEIIVTDSGVIFLHLGDGSTYLSTSTTTTNFSNAGWKHFAITLDRDGNALTYVDSVLERTNSISGAQGTLTNSLDLGIMTRSDGNYAANGSIDELLIFNRSLSSTEVEALYDAKNNKFDASFTGLSAGYHNYTVFAIDEDMNRVSSYRNFLVSGTALSACQDLNTANTVYYLSNNVSSAGTCFYVTAQNVTIDCQGYRITYSTDGGNGEYGVSSDSFNTTVRNCHILDGNTADDQWTPSIILNDGANYSTVYNNLIDGDSLGLWLANPWYVNVSNNIISVTRANSVYVEGAVNNTFTNNNFTAPSDYALRTSYYLYPARYNTFIGNTIYSGTTYATYMGGSTYNTFINNTIVSGSTSANGALGLYDDTVSSDYNTFINNTIRGYRGVYLSNAEYNNFVGNNITASYNGMNLASSSNNLFRDCIALDGGTYAFYTQNAVTNVTLINCSFTFSKGIVNSGGSVTNKWYYRAYANYSNSTAAAGVNITINNSAGAVGDGGWSSELVSNPSFESGLTGWTTSGAYWAAGSSGYGGNATAHDGSYVAYTNNGGSSSTYVYQDVDVSAYATEIDAGTARVSATGWGIASEIPPQDRSRVQIIYLNSGKSILETAADSGNLGIQPWWETGVTNDVPPVGTRYVRVWGNTYEAGYNSGCIDDYSVLVYTPPAPLVTDGTGYIPRQELTEYINNAGTRTYYNNYTINATLNTTSITHTINFTIKQNQVYDYFTFNASGVNCGIISTPNSVYNLTSNATTSGSCLIIEAQNVTINCSGYSIIGANTTDSIGIYSNYPYTKIENCNILNFSTGIYLNYSANNSWIKNVNINQTYSSTCPVLSGRCNAVALMRPHNISIYDLDASAARSKTTLLMYSLNNITAYNSIIDSINMVGIRNLNLTNISISSLYLDVDNLGNVSNIRTSRFGTYAWLGLDPSFNCTIKDSVFDNVDIDGGEKLYFSNLTINGSLDFSTSPQNSSLINSRINNGIYIYHGRNLLISNVTVFSETNPALYTLSTYENITIANSSFRSNNSNVIYLQDYTRSSIFINNTFISGTGSGNLIRMDAAAGNNTFYWNNFTQTSGYYINNTNSTNKFNTTVGGVAQGNYYYNISSKEVYDTDSNGWGDDGSEYPLNATNWNTKWTGFGQDYGPATTRGLDCGGISSPGVYTLTKNVSSTGTCFTITSDNVILDCNGFWINYSTGGGASTYGVDAPTYTNITIKNCNIVDGNWTSASTNRYGLNVGDLIITLFNNYIYTSNSRGVYANGFNSSNVTNNRIISNSNSGMFLINGFHNVFMNNNLTNNNEGWSGIYLQSSSNNTFINNNFLCATHGHGITLYLSNNNNLTNNNATSNSGFGIYSSSSSNNTLINNSATSNSSYAIFFTSSSNNTLKNNTVIANGGGAAFQLSDSSNNLFTNNSFRNKGSGLSSDAGISISNSHNNTFTINTFRSDEKIGFAMYSSSNNTLTSNGIISSGIASFGVFLNGGSSNSLINNTVNGSLGLYVESSNNAITNNTLTATSDSGIYITYSLNNTLTNNNCSGTAGIYISYSNNSALINNNATGTTLPGIWLGTSSNNSLRNNLGTSSSSHGIYIYFASNNNTLINNTGISGGANYGIYLASNSNNNTLINNTGINAINGVGIRLDISSYNTFTNNNATSNSGYGTILYQSSNNTFTNDKATSYSAHALYVWESFNNTFTNQIARTLGTTGTRYGVYVRNSNNSIFRDCINISGATADVFYYDASGSINNTFINCSYNIAKETVQGTGNELIRKWYYMAYVNYSNGTAASGANVSAYNVSSSLQFTDLTAGTGWIDRQEVTEYINRVGTRSYFNNYTISPTKSGYYADTHIFNFTITQNKMNDWFTLYNTTCVYLSGNWYINCSESCTVLASYDVQGNNITIVGSGTVLVTGNVTNYNKLHIEGVDTTHICTVRCINGGCFKS